MDRTPLRIFYSQTFYRCECVVLIAKSHLLFDYLVLIIRGQVLVPFLCPSRSLRHPSDM